ncbi:MAG: putative ribosomal protein modification [Nocardioidaceae bacterium]|nr:putative ribosomal protein modification [Nocardioidaceae bacterium]
MDPETFSVTRVSDTEWHAVDDGRVVGSGDHALRLDGRTFLSIDSWDDDVFAALVTTILADVPGPLNTLVDDFDEALLGRWRDAGFEVAGREHAYVVATDPAFTGLAGGQAPAPDPRHLIRIGGRPRQPRVAVLTQDPDLARALLADTLGSLHRSGTTTAVLDVPEDEVVTLALLETIGARLTGTSLELVHR